MISISEFLVNNHLNKKRTIENLQNGDYVHIRTTFQNGHFIEGFGQIAQNGRIISRDGYVRWEIFVVYDPSRDNKDEGVIRKGALDDSGDWLDTNILKECDITEASAEEINVVDTMYDYWTNERHTQQYHVELGIYNRNTQKLTKY